MLSASSSMYSSMDWPRDLATTQMYVLDITVTTKREMPMRTKVSNMPLMRTLETLGGYKPHPSCGHVGNLVATGEHNGPPIWTKSRFHHFESKPANSIKWLRERTKEANSFRGFWEPSTGRLWWRPICSLVFEKSKHIVDDQENDGIGEDSIPPGEPNQNFPTVWCQTWKIFQ